MNSMREQVQMKYLRGQQWMVDGQRWAVVQRDLDEFRWWAAEEGNRRRKSRTKVGGREKGGATPEMWQRQHRGTRPRRAGAVGQQTGKQRLLAGGVCGCTCWNNLKRGRSLAMAPSEIRTLVCLNEGMGADL